MRKRQYSDTLWNRLNLQGLKALANIRTLKHLGFSGGGDEDLTDEVLRELVNKLPMLTSINLQGKPLIFASRRFLATASLGDPLRYMIHDIRYMIYDTRRGQSPNFWMCVLGCTTNSIMRNSTTGNLFVYYQRNCGSSLRCAAVLDDPTNTPETNHKTAYRKSGPLFRPPINSSSPRFSYLPVL